MDNDLKSLNNKEQEIICSLSVLSCKLYSIPELVELFKVTQHEMPPFFDTIHDLSNNGFLKREKALYGLDENKCKKLLSKIEPKTEQCSTIINYFLDKLERSELNYESEFLPIYKQLTSLFQKITDNTLQLAQLSYLLSNQLVKFKKYKDALNYNQQAIKISEAVDNQHPVVALFYRDKALIHKKLGDNQAAIISSLKDIEILENHAGKYDDLLPDSYFALSKTYEGVQNYEKAAEYNLKAIQFAEKRTKRKTLNISGLYHNLAYYYVKLNNMKNASLFINKAVESFIESKYNNDKHYKNLIRDQKRFNSLFEFEQFLLKYRFVLIAAAGVFLTILIWAIIRLLA